MKAKYFILICSFLVLFLGNLEILSAQIYINEFIASNDTGLTDESGDFEDWVELYNAGSSAVDIGGYYVSDDLAELNLWQIPTTSPAQTTIAAGGYLILWLDKDTDDGVLHINAKLSGSGEDIVLTTSDGVTIVDSYTYGEQMTDVSEGRITDGNSQFIFFTSPTPNTTNTESSGTVPTPTLSMVGGLYDENITVNLNTTIPASIYYTTDGSTPDESSNLYSTPLLISTPTPIRARAFANDLEPSNIVTETYLVGISHAYPILAVAGNSEDFFDDSIGIFGNILEDIEINVNVEFYEPDGTLGFNQLVEAELTGTSSAGNAQKSLSLKAKGSLGSSTFDYPIFPNEDETEYRGLVLRNSGNDWAVTNFRDAAASSLISDLSDVDDLISPPKINYQAYRQSILYLNGEYWGIYNLRERADKRYIKNHFDLDDNEIDLIENRDEAKEGDLDNWLALQDFLEDTDFSNDANFTLLEDWVDVDEFMDYAIFNLYIDNQDWPGNNNRRFRERVAEGKWRFLCYDLDFTFGLYTSQGWDTGYAGDNSIDRLLNPNATEWPNPEWSTRLFQKLLENQTWRNDFINRTADQLNVLFTPERINERIDDFLVSYEPEIEQQLATWQNLYNQVNSADKMRSFANLRSEIFQQQYINALGDIQSMVEVNLSTEPNGAGSIEFSTLNVDEEDDQGSWNGRYFSGIDIPVKAVAKPGYVFKNWIGISSSTDDEITVNLSQNSLLRALFAPVDTTINLQTQTINFQEIADQETDSSPIELFALASSNLPVTFTILSGPATLNGNIVTLTGTEGIVTVRASQSGNSIYSPAPDVIQNFTVGSGTTPGVYCETQALNSSNLWIKQVKLAEINNLSENDNGYGDYLGQTAFLAPNQFYFVKLTAGFANYVGDIHWRLWIDFNQNQSFDDGEEVITEYIATIAQGIDALETNLVFSVPPTATSGTSRLRISLRQNAFAPACGDYDAGETEDYTVAISENFMDDDPGFLTLEATPINDAISLFWAANELDETESFTIEKSTDGITFQELRTIVNESEAGIETATFEFLDNSPSQGLSIYRLRKNLSNSTIIYSNTTEVDYRFDAEGLVIYPNPLRKSDKLHVSFGAYFTGKIDITMISITGQIVEEIKLDEVPDTPFEVSLKNYTEGAYFLRVVGEGFRPLTKKFVVFE